jgi:hypothetical protein
MRVAVPAAHLTSAFSQIFRRLTRDLQNDFPILHPQNGPRNGIVQSTLLSMQQQTVRSLVVAGWSVS